MSQTFPADKEKFLPGIFGAPSGRMFQRVKVPNPPDSGKDIAKSKGVLGNWESEGSWRQITGLTNRNHEG